MTSAGRLTLFLVGAGVCLAEIGRAQEAVFVKVIPPGKEQLFGEMLGDRTALPGGCAYGGAALDRTFVSAQYTCPNKSYTVELRHPADAPGATITTTRFAIVPKGAVPAALIAALKQRIIEREAPFRWVSAEAPGLGQVATGPTPSTTPSSGLSPEESDQYVAGVKLYRDQKYKEALDAFLALGRKNPHGGVLGMVVASLASTTPDLAAVNALAAEADAKPQDPLAQFVAGVAAHYFGHRAGRSREAKAALYATAIKYLERARPAFEFEPRLFVYLAISHYRLGHQQEAQALIEKAVPLSTNDPDVYYCRAEVYQAVDVQRSIKDIESYLAMVDRLRQQGVPSSSVKDARVKRMLGRLQEVAQGKAPLPKNDDLFDPLPPVGKPAPASATTAPGSTSKAPPPSTAAASMPRVPRRIFRSSREFGGLAVIIGLLVGTGWLVLARRRGRRGT